MRKNSSDVTIVNCVRNLSSKEIGVPAGPLFVVSSLRKANIKTSFIDYQTVDARESISIDTLLRFLGNSAPILAIGCYRDLLPLVVLAVEALKREEPSKKIILGAHGPTAVADQLLAAFPFIDVVVKGEAEETMKELVGKMMNGQAVDDVYGISFRKNDKVKSNPPRPRIKNLSNLFPDYTVVSLEKYSLAHISTTRGCPFRCTFCAASPFWQHVTTTREITDIINEIGILYHNYKFRQFWITDDTFTLDKNLVLDFCREFKKQFPDAKWSCYGRINTINGEMIATMADSGCDRIFYGIESGSNKILRKINKQFTVEEAETKIKMSSKYLTCRLGFIWGFPFERFSDFLATINFIGRLKNYSKNIKIQFYMLNPTPSSSLYAEYGASIKFNPNLPTDMEGINTQKTDPKTKKKILQLVQRYPQVFPNFYYFPTPNLNQKLAIVRFLSKSKVIDNALDRL